MSLDVSLMKTMPCAVFEANITHNLGTMARYAELYQPLWRPEELGVKTAGQLIPLLELGLSKLRVDPEGYRKYEAPNGWGKYEDLVQFVESYLAACREYPEAEVRASR